MQMNIWRNWLCTVQSLQRLSMKKNGACTGMGNFWAAYTGWCEEEFGWEKRKRRSGTGLEGN